MRPETRPFALLEDIAMFFFKVAERRDRRRRPIKINMFLCRELLQPVSVSLSLVRVHSNNR